MSPTPISSDAPVFLVGFMASGKTTVGRLLAHRLGWQFRDLDHVIVEAAGRSVADIFRAEGEEGFRRREAEAVVAAGRWARTIVATGGGAACREANLAAMLAAGRVVALAVEPAEVVRRTRGDGSRPLLAGAADPLQAATELLAARAPFYARAHHRVDTSGKEPEAVADEVLRVLDAVAP